MKHASCFPKILSGLIVAILVVSVAPSAFAYDRTDILECGAKIVSNQRGPTGEFLCLFVEQTSDRTKVAVRTCPAESQPGFLWKIVRHNGGGVHILSAATNEERRMEVEGWSKADRAQIQMWGPNGVGEGYRNQTWDFLPVANGALIISVDSGKCLNVPIRGNPVNQEFLIQFTCSRVENDTWRIEPVLRGCN